MDRSLGFVSTPYDFGSFRFPRAFNTRFRFGFRASYPLTLPYNVTRWLIMQKARRQPFP